MKRFEIAEEAARRAWMRDKAAARECMERLGERASWQPPKMYGSSSSDDDGQPRRGRGRPRRFSTCPECGAPSLFVRNTRLQGACRNSYCVCTSCDVVLRHISTGTGGRWLKVRKQPQPVREVA